ncbi:hypothetical protein ACFLR4_03010 [Bacteroidota bacterium]
MSRKFKNIDRSELKKLDIKFCTACEAALDEWFAKPDSFDIDAVKANHENCKRIGRFEGEMCARLFISMNEKIEEFLKDEDD